LVQAGGGNVRIGEHLGATRTTDRLVGCRSRRWRLSLPEQHHGPAPVDDGISDERADSRGRLRSGRSRDITQVLYAFPQLIRTDDRCEPSGGQCLQLIAKDMKHQGGQDGLRPSPEERGSFDVGCERIVGGVTVNDLQNELL
jgi:hypothetical protein